MFSLQMDKELWDKLEEIAASIAYNMKQDAYSGKIRTHALCLKRYGFSEEVMPECGDNHLDSGIIPLVKINWFHNGMVRVELRADFFDKSNFACELFLSKFRTEWQLYGFEMIV